METKEYLFSALHHLSARYPHLVKRISNIHLVIEIEFFHEETALECAQSLLDHGISAVHRLDRPKCVSLQRPSIDNQNQYHLLVETLEAYLRPLVPYGAGIKKGSPVDPSTNQGDEHEYSI